MESMEKELQYTKKSHDLAKNQEVEKISAQFKVDQAKRDLAIVEKEKILLGEQSALKSKRIFITTAFLVLLLILLGFMYYSYKKKKANYELKIFNETLLKDKKDAERLTNLKSKFISRVSHELRTPLYGIIGITSMLQEDRTLKINHRETLNALKFSGDHLIKLVDTLINIKQIEYQNIELHISETNLRSVAKNILSSLKFMAMQNRNTLELFVASDVSESYLVDSVQLSKILISLIENAIKFTEHGKIHLSIIKEEDLDQKHRLKFTVKDTGEGILEENLSLIFDKFNQAKDEMNITEGIGLGLPMVKHLLKIMNSEIHVESTYGEGSVFSFSLVLPVGTTSKFQEKKEVLLSKFPFKNLLVAEDNKMCQMVTCKLITIIGHGCNIAENGMKAYEAIKKLHIDLILMDLNMPVMDGFEAARKIKELQPNITIVALTANDISKVRERCFSSGMVDVVNKPINKVQLDSLIRKYA